MVRKNPIFVFLQIKWRAIMESRYDNSWIQTILLSKNDNHIFIYIHTRTIHLFSFQKLSLCEVLRLPSNHHSNQLSSPQNTKIQSQKQTNFLFLESLCLSSSKKKKSLCLSLPPQVQFTDSGLGLGLGLRLRLQRAVTLNSLPLGFPFLESILLFHSFTLSLSLSVKKSLSLENSWTFGIWTR